MDKRIEMMQDYKRALAWDMWGIVIKKKFKEQTSTGAFDWVIESSIDVELLKWLKGHTATIKKIVITQGIYDHTLHQRPTALTCSFYDGNDDEQKRSKRIQYTYCTIECILERNHCIWFVVMMLVVNMNNVVFSVHQSNKKKSFFNGNEKQNEREKEIERG